MISKRHLFIPVLIAVIAVLIVVGAAGAAIYAAANKTDASKTPTKFEVSLPETKTGYQSSDSHIIGGSLNVSGQLKTDGLQVVGGIATSTIAVSGAASVGSLTLSPSNSSTHKVGQLYVSTDGSLNYYNGKSAVNIGTPTLSASNAVLSLQGQTGSVSLTGGDGIAINGTTITNNGVTTIGGVAGNVALGTGLKLVGNTLTSDAIHSATSLSSDILVATDANGNLTISSHGSGLGGMIALAPATPQGDASNAASIGINKTGTGNLIQLSTGTTPVNRFVVDQLGAITSGSISFSQVTGAPSIVSSIGGAVGNVTLGSGLVMVGGQLSATASGVTSITGTTDQVIVSGGSNAVLSLPQSIAVSSTPSFAGLNLSFALSVVSGGTGASTASGARTSLGAAAAGANNDITQLSALTTINPTAALAIGGAGQNLTLQGASTSLSANAGGSTTTLAFAAPTANVTYRLQTAVAGTYDVCTTTGNCAGIGGGVTTAGGTINSLAKFTNTGAIGNSNISDNGTVVTISGPLAVSTITPTSAATFGATTQSLVLQGSSTSLTSTSAGITNALTFATPSGSAKTIIIPNASGTVAISATGALSLDSNGNVSCPTCLTSGGGATGGVSTVNGLNGALTIASITPSSILTSGSSITIQDASSTVKGLASFNATNLVVSNGAVNTIQGISTSASPTFAGLTLTSSLGVTSGGTGVTSAPAAGQLLIGNGAGYTLNTLTAGAGIAITNGAGGITIDSTVTPGCPTCATQALNNLSSVALNTSLLPGVTNTIDMGSSSLAFRNGYLAGALQVGSLDAASAAALTIGSTNATAINLNQNTTLAANKSLTISGGNTASRPATPTAGMVYYDSTTNQLLQYNGTKWVGDRSTSTKIVAASNSSQAAKDAADYVATGTGDQATINTALTAASGGLVYLMEGTYSETAAISVPNNTTLAGAGAGTLITIPNAQNGSYNIITNTDTSTGTRVTVRDLRVDGNKANQTSGSMQGIYLSGMGGGTGSTARDGAKVTDVNVRTVYGASAAGISLSGSSNNTLIGNTSLGNGSTGIYLSSSSHNTVDSNTSQGNGFYGINILGGSNNTVTGNTTQGNGSTGIAITGASTGNALTGNVLQGNSSYGIYFDSVTNNTITGNTILGSGASGVRLYASSGNNINGNKVHDSSASGGNSGIQLDSNSTNNSVIDNDITDTSCTSSCYAINISGAGSSSNYLANNRHSGTAANPSTINDTGTGTIYANQPDGAGNLINKSQGGGLTVGASAATASLTLQGGLASTTLPTPAAATLSTSGTAGSTTYGYRVSALDGLGETLASTETTITTGNAILTGTNKINITWIPVGGAYQYRIYRSTSGGTPATTGLITTVAGNIATISDTGLAASGGAVASVNTTGGGNFAGQIQGGSLNVTGTSSLTGAVTLGVASSTTGQLKLANATSAFVATLQVASLSQDATYTLPVSSGSSDTFCLLTLANCNGGVAAVGALDGGTANANGVTISGTTMYLQSASASFAGLVNTAAQTFAGAKTFNSNVTVAASQSLTITGGNTASRPASPTAGMVYYDTTTSQLVQYNGTKWVGDHSTSTKIVAASNSTQAAKDAADYVATGTGDQATINTALTAASGGLVYLTEGTYNETAAISIPNSTTLAGAGAGTLITIPNAQNGTYNIITNTDTTTGVGVTVRDLRIDGNQANQTSGSMAGIYLNGMGGGSGNTAREGAKLTNLTIRGVYTNATSGAIYLSGSNNNTINGNVLEANGYAGIYITSSSNYNTISGNTSQGNSTAGIYLTSSSSNNTVTGNTTQGNSFAGIYINSSSSSNTITGNIAQGNGNTGIHIINSSSNNTISGNTVQGNTNRGIDFQTTSISNTVTGNKIHDNGGASANNGIYVDASSANSITSNDITDTSCTTTCYAINVFNATAIANYLADNRHTGTAANPSTINDAGTGTIYASQLDGSGSLINKSQGGALTVGAASATASLTLQGSLAATALPVPTLSSTVTNTGSAGATTYRYQITALDGLGETTGSTIQQTTTGNATLSGANYNTIAWTPVGGAYQYRVYRCTGAACTPALLATVPGSNSIYKDQAAGAPSGAVPVANATGGASFTGAIQGSSATLGSTLSVSGATSLGQLTVTGVALFKNTADSTTAFQIQKSDASVLFAADTTNMTVTIAKLIVTGDITVNGHIVTGGSAPTIAAGTATCTTPTLNVSGNDTAGTLTLTTGTGCSATGTMATITFNKVFGGAPRVTFTPKTAASAGLGIYNGASSTTTFTIDTSVIPVDTTTYTFNYLAVQ